MNPMIMAAIARENMNPREMIGGADDMWSLSEPLERYLAKDLRREVYRLKLKVQRKGDDINDHKQGYIALLRHYRDKKLGVFGASGDSSTCGMPGVQSLRDMVCDPSSSLVPSLHELQPSAVSMEDDACEPRAHGYVSDGDVESIGMEDSPTASIQVFPSTFTGATTFPIDSEREATASTTSNAIDGAPNQAFDQTVRYTSYWEGRLVKAKRKMSELAQELQSTSNKAEDDMLRDEFAYYMRERKRALYSLLSTTSDK